MGKDDLIFSSDQSQEFFTFLKRGGRSKAAIERVFKLIDEYRSFLVKAGRNFETGTANDLLDFVAEIEAGSKASAKTHLWAIRYFYEYTANEEMALLVAGLREQRIKHTPFPLKDFRGVNPVHVQKLAEMGIVNVQHMLARGATPEARQSLAEQTGIPPESILEFVKLSDLARIQGIKGVRARLYADAGVDTIEKLAQWDPTEFQEMIVEFVERTGFEGIPTLPAEAVSAVRKAKKLSIIIEI